MIKTFHPSKSNSFPQHIGIIPDGARRWAKKQNITYLESYRISMKKLITICDYLYFNKVTTISIYFSSIQNFKRTDEEVYAFSKAEEEFINHFSKNKEIKLVGVGNKKYLPSFFNNTLTRVENETRHNSTYLLNLCVAYNPLEEVEYAVKQKNFINNLWVTTPLDIVIRTGDANLLSNFLPLQSGFARLYFLDNLFNDVDMKEIETILYHFQNIDRIFGE